MPLISLATLTSRVYSRLDGNSLLYPSSEITTAINECIKITNLMIGYVQGQQEVGGYSVPNRHYYNSPPGIILPTKVQYEGLILEPTTLTDLGKSHPGWTTDTTANTGYPVEQWAPIGLTKFAIWPADSIGGNQMIVSGVMEPPVLVNPTDTINWPKEVLATFDLICVSSLMLKESDRLFEEQSKDYSEFLKTVKRQTFLQNFKAPRYWVSAEREEVRP